MSTRFLLVPFVLCTMGVFTLCFSGCGKQDEASSTSRSPAVYMNDAAFRRQLADSRKELQAIVARRAPLVKRMEKMAADFKGNRAELETIDEWNDLHQKVEALNAQYEAARQRQLALVHDRIAPQGK